MAQRRTITLFVTLTALACSGFRAAVAQAQAPEIAVPQFEVASVKQDLSESTQSNINSRLPDRFLATNMPLFFLIQNAYELHGYDLVGAPDWTWDKSYDVVGTYPGAHRPSAREIHLMLQQLLADRFALKVHREQRDLPAYDLILSRKDGRLGPQMHASGMDCKAWVADGRPKTPPGRPSPVSPSAERPVCNMLATRQWMSGGARTMQDIAGILGALSGRTVIDKTGLTGSYDIDLKWSPMELHAEESAAPASSEGPSLFTAVEDQLGLKLTPHKERFEVLVVDEVKPPSPN